MIFVQSLNSQLVRLNHDEIFHDGQTLMLAFEIIGSTVPEIYIFIDTVMNIQKVIP